MKHSYYYPYVFFLFNTGCRTSEAIALQWKHVSPDYRIWLPVLTKLEVEYRKPYQARHTFITLALEHGLSVQDVARLVGNSPEVIYRHYAGNKQELFVPEF